MLKILDWFPNAWTLVVSRDIRDHLHSSRFSAKIANLGLVAGNINMNQICPLSPRVGKVRKNKCIQKSSIGAVIDIYSSGTQTCMEDVPLN